MNQGQLVILLIDDDENDILFFQLATNRSGLRHTVRHTSSAAEAIQYLCGEGKYSDRSQFPMPHVVMSDLKMPGMNGFEFLKWVRTHQECSGIPTIIFSSSTADADVREAYKLGANAFIVKPHSVATLSDLLRVVYQYWTTCERPPLPASC